MLHDLRFAARRLASRPAFTALIVLILALGIGAASAVFTIVDHVLFRLPPFTNAHRLVQVSHLDRPLGGGGSSLSPAKIAGWQSQDAFERFEAFAPQAMEMTGAGEPERVSGYLVTTNLFQMLGVPPQIGRLFLPPDGKSGAEPVVIISDALWKRRFGADLGVIGRSVNLNGERYSIVGVMPRRFSLSQSVFEEFWIPVDVTAPGTYSGLRRFLGLAWAPDGTTIEALQARVDQLGAELQASTPIAEGWYVGVRPRTVAFVDANARITLLVLLGVVGVLLLITCANAANLSLVQATARAREVAVRAALGASRGRLMREVITENVLVAALGGAAGVFVARWGIDMAFSLAPGSMYFLTPQRIEIDTRVLAVMLLATLASGILFGLVPAVRGTSPALDVSLRGFRAGSPGPSGRLSSGIVVIEIAMALVLLVGAVLIARTFINLNAIDPGFEPRGIVTAEIALPTDRYPTPAARNGFFSDLAESLQASSGIESVAFGMSAVSGSFGITYGLQSEDGSRMTEIVGVNSVTRNYFQTARIRLIAGRTFEDGATDAVVVSQSLAERLWPRRSALGRQLRMGERGPWQTVVGVARDVENRLLLSGPVTEQRMAMFMYVPFGDFGPAAPPSSRALQRFVPRVLIVRASDPQAAVSLIRARVAALDPAQPVGSIAFGENTYANLFDRQRFVLVLMTVFAAVAMLLAAAGIFAVLAQTVVQRTREIGVRVALGATSRDIVRMILSQGFALAAIGSVAGLVTALAVTRVLTSLLYGVSPADPLSYATVAVVLAAVAMLACWLPARRAVRIEPALALRVD